MKFVRIFSEIAPLNILAPTSIWVSLLVVRKIALIGFDHSLSLPGCVRTELHLYDRKRHSSFPDGATVRVGQVKSRFGKTSNAKFFAHSDYDTKEFVAKAKKVMVEALKWTPLGIRLVEPAEGFGGKEPDEQNPKFTQEEKRVKSSLSLSCVFWVSNSLPNVRPATTKVLEHWIDVFRTAEFF